ncbi:MAG TPA: hypothetical protein VN844_27550 [Pyrinomonadaceae bacterium]|nr:hypothetical protein [Pyrinomonadaceae bacterium]
MYATKLITDVYHLVLATRYHTLCGLRISRVPLGAKLPGNLQLVEEAPPKKTVCKHCERIRNHTD